MVKNLLASVGVARDVGWIPGLRRFPGEENGNALQYSGLGNPVDRGAWWGNSPWSPWSRKSWATEHACKISLQTSRRGLALSQPLVTGYSVFL